jgi:ParB/RepB/Spo0J family partition protein
VELELDDLATNIHANGQAQPILVFEKSDSPGEYEVLEGQRRLNAFDKLNQKFDGQGYDKILAIIREEPENNKKKKSISLGANICQLPMTQDDIQKGVVELWTDVTSIPLVAEQYGISEKTVKRYVRGARLSPRLKEASVNQEVDSDPEKAIDKILEAVDLLSWDANNDVSEEKVIKTARKLCEKDASIIRKALQDDPERDPDKIPTDGVPQDKSFRVTIPPEVDASLSKFAKSREKKKSDAAAEILITALNQLVSSD